MNLELELGIVTLIALAVAGLWLVYRIWCRENLFENRKVMSIIGMSGGLVSYIGLIGVATTTNPIWCGIAAVGLVTLLSVWMHFRGLWDRLFVALGE